MTQPGAARKVTIFAAGIIVVAAAVAYSNSFGCPFVFDDGGSIEANTTIRSLWPIRPALSPPASGLTVSGRPVINLSFALNYALGGINVRGYHAANLAIHILAALVLFGIVRRTLERTAPRRMDSGKDASLTALMISVLWCVHPLQTESVTYISQRAESLMGLFYLLTLYGFIRAVESTRPRGWFLVSIAACILGMATKEVMVSAPVIVFLYDRTFVAGTFREAWRRRWALHAGLACTWLLLAVLLAGTRGRGGTVGFGTSVSWHAYLATQFPAILDYLRLSVWPRSLVFGYGGQLAHGVWMITLCALLVMILAAGTVVALRISPRLGFLGASFFAILAPSSSFIPVATETVAEHRMYLPLAAVVSGAVLAIQRGLGRRSMALFAAVAVGLTFMTLRRNLDYRTNLALWSDTVAKQQNNPLAHFNLGVALFLDGNPDAANIEYQEAVRLKPDHPEALLNLGNGRIAEGRISDAISCFEKALQARPGYPEAYNALGLALFNAGRLNEAVAWLRQAVQFRPDFSEAHHNLGLALARLGREAEAISQFREVVRLQPADGNSYADLGVTLAFFGHADEAIPAYEQALKLKPGFAYAHYNLGNALMEAGRLQEAIGHYQEALRLNPGYYEAHANLGVAFAKTDRMREAVAQFDQALRINSNDATVHRDLGLALRALGRMDEANAQMEAAVRLRESPR